MIRTLFREREQLYTLEGLPTVEILDGDFAWVEMAQAAPEEIERLKAQFGIDMRPRQGMVIEEGDYLYMHANLAGVGADNEIYFYPIQFVLGEKLLVTACTGEEFPGLALAVQRLTRQLKTVDSPRAVLRVVLQAANDAADKVMHTIVESLETTSDYISEISDGYDEQGRELGVMDLTNALLSLNEMEERISRCLEAQIDLGRVVRYLRGEINKIAEASLLELVDDLAGDVAAVKEHATLEHDKVRYLQNAVTNILNIKQNQIVKVFTIITAVFLPPTLVATFYGMNFNVMPELSWKYGFTYSIILTLVAALLPMIYIKKKGWLR